ncbi:dienelactone hydrolase family protein [Legionella hackeliae]|uniref:Dienelactone hydrolase domain-containing protein n=1 Tax=Legionella hackeliae TaxID=449 RepID=A0A0A8USR1_LEGHA|nr:DeoR family transcriptional regulator [Legionella hackeliae]KTD13840.1 hypothetical protein Lhac_0684 [Legionella hackeliae]CEK10541.1 conserved protein of unknown function [Legionella hackeliae]STX47280.1 Predicted dienelactone hydrolase [Legionella hackeliae]
MNYSLNAAHNITITKDDVSLSGFLLIPQDALGLVLFAHGSGSSRFSIRNHFVAKILNKAKLATLLFDLLMPEEEALDLRTREFRFNISLLAQRLLEATDWCQREKLNLPLGYFGASTGAAAALIASTLKTESIKAVVSRGGRPDLAKEFLSRVTAPTLLIVGGNDEVVITMNEDAFSQMECVKQLEIVSGATHLFEESGTLNQAAQLAKNWFVRYLSAEQ